MKSLKPILWGLLLVLGIVFFVQNIETLTYRTTLEFNLVGPLRFRSVPLGLYVFLLVSFLLGLLLSGLYGFVEIYRLRRALRAAKRQNQSLQEELKSLRNLPITEGEVSGGHPADTSRNESVEKAGGTGLGKNNVMDG
ncbi:MAG: lipopolysaccharide assembly protein LapA domain-containing protein [Syntrophobacteria bacterium]